MIRLYDLPGIAAVETRVVLNDLTGVRLDHDLSRMLDEIQWKVFGIQGDPSLKFSWVDEDASDADDIEHWRNAGWDVTGPEGGVLKSLEHFESAMICVTEGYDGNPMLEIEAAAWARKHAANNNASPQQVQRNQAFLDLGTRRRRHGR